MDPITFALGLSLHLGFENTYNPVHPHIRYTNESIITGIYYNSEERISMYIGQRLEHEDFGFEYGAVTGYSTGAVLPYVRGTYKDFFIAPALENGERLGIVVGTELKF